MLKKGDSTKLVIAHIGDSHIQADMFSGKIRGLVFPYKAAKTNGPADYRSYTNCSWDTKRVIATSNQTPIGISGITIKTSCDTSFVRLKMKEGVLDYHFNRIKLIHEQNLDNYDIQIKDTSGKNLGFIKSSKYLGEYRLSNIKLDTLLDEVIFQSIRIDSSQTFSQFYGFILENSRVLSL